MWADWSKYWWSQYQFGGTEVSVSLSKRSVSSLITEMSRQLLSHPTLHTLIYYHAALCSCMSSHSTGIRAARPEPMLFRRPHVITEHRGKKSECTLGLIDSRKQKYFVPLHKSTFSCMCKWLMSALVLGLWVGLGGWCFWFSRQKSHLLSLKEP